MKQDSQLNTFSHEINNSLALIYSQLQYIEQTNDSLKQSEDWKRMKEDFSSLFDLIRQILSPAMSTSAALEPVDLIELFEEIRQSWKYKLQEENISFSIQTDGSSPYYVCGPRTKLLQLFHNLVSNSIKAIIRKKEARKLPFISIQLNEEQGHIVCSLSDNGIGMTKEQQSRAFYRGVSFAPDGSGIGLSVVDEIAKEFHINIQLDSAANHGTTFTLIFPASSYTEK